MKCVTKINGKFIHLFSALTLIRMTKSFNMNLEQIAITIN